MLPPGQVPATQRRLFAGLALWAALTVSAPAVADNTPPSTVSLPTEVPSPLASDYVDVGLHAGPAWRGNAVDSRYSAFGYGLGMTLDIGRAPYWGGVYVDVGILNSKAGVVDPANNEKPSIILTSGGYHGKVAIRLSPRLYFMPAVGVGVGISDYRSGQCLKHVKENCHDVRYIGLGVQADATFIYMWRFAALTVEPLRISASLFERQSDSVMGAVGTAPGDTLGLARNGVSLGAAVGFSLDLSAMVLAMRDGVVGVTNSIVGQ
jgi:hypothetical protein